MDLATAQRILADAGAHDRDVFVQAYLTVQEDWIRGGDRVKDFYGSIKAQPDEPADESAETGDEE